MTMPRPRVGRATRLCLTLVFWSGMVVGRAHAEQSTATTAPPAAMWQASAVNVTRFESWGFFEPQPGGGDPDYTFLGNRLRVEARGRWRRVELTLAAQHVGLVGLPTGASGPGALGTGALYFDQGGRRQNPQDLWIRYAQIATVEWAHWAHCVEGT